MGEQGTVKPGTEAMLPLSDNSPRCGTCQQAIDYDTLPNNKIACDYGYRHKSQEPQNDRCWTAKAEAKVSLGYCGMGIGGDDG
jgi:hypothetical protein